MIRTPIVLAAILAFASTSAAQPPDLSGRWSGYWVSDKNGHTGPLHGRFRQLDDATYRVAYHGRFWRIFPFYYRTTMHVDGAGEGVAMLSASQRLGPLGTFTTTALATDTDFSANFAAPRDSGRFVMSRRR
jgi:hypothetical protein